MIFRPWKLFSKYAARVYGTTVHYAVAFLGAIHLKVSKGRKFRVLRWDRKTNGPEPFGRINKHNNNNNNNARGKKKQKENKNKKHRSFQICVYVRVCVSVYTFVCVCTSVRGVCVRALSSRYACVG